MRQFCAILVSLCLGCLLPSSAANAAYDNLLSIQPGSWTLAVMPDIQHYEGTTAGGYAGSQTGFLAACKTSLNLGYVIQEGDITNGNTTTQWGTASAAFAKLEAAGIPYTLATGNHDYTGNGDYRTSGMSTAFPTSRLETQATYGGCFEPGNSCNTYSLFSAGSKDYVVVSLEFGARNSALQWADGIIKTYSDREAMVVTHAYMYSDSTRYDYDTKGTTQEWSPFTHAIGENDGEDMWNVLKTNENLKFVFSGHVINDGTGYLASTADNGNVVHQMLANYQFLSNGGNGYMRLLEFLGDGESVHVRTYSPILDSYLTTSDQDFVIKLNEVPAPKPIVYNAVASQIVVTGSTTGNFDSIAVTKSGSPGASISQANRGDYQISVDGEGCAYTQGIMLASVTQNTRDGIHASVEVGRNSFSDGYLALSVTQAGSGAEVNCNVATAWFKYEAGWQGAHINSDGTLASSSTNITQSMITKPAAGCYQVKLDGGRSPSAGLLFAIGNDNSNGLALTAPSSDKSGWDIRTQSNKTDFSGTLTDANFSLLYLPLDTPGLIGGYFSGTGGVANNILSAGTFSMTRTTTGTYKLTIPGETPDTGMLILSICCAATKSGVIGPDDNILTYEGDADGNFMIYSYDLPNCTGLQDTQFVWAFMDYTNPITLAPVPEPSTLALLLVGLGAVWIARNKRRSPRS